MDAALESSTMRKIYLRLLPFAIFATFSPISIGSTSASPALTMRGDLGMSATAFGFAVGTFYWGYFIFEVPSNVIMEKVGARIWIARIMITWGIFAGLTALVTGSTSFGIVRFLLGVAEAGFFPGIVLYFTYWFPPHHHARIVSGFLIGLPIAVAGGAPISTGAAGPGWPVRSARAGRSCTSPRASRPSDRHHHAFRADRSAGAGEFPDRGGKDLAEHQAAAERKAKEAVRTFTPVEGMFNPKVLLLALNYFGIVVASLGMLFFIPQIIKSLGVTEQHDGRLADHDPLHLRRHRPGGVGPRLRPDERAALEPARRLRGVDGRADHRRHDDGHLVGDGRHVDRGVRVLRLEGTVLADAADVPHRHGGGGLDRMDQLDRQSRRLLRPLVCRRDEGPDRQLRGRAVWAGAAVPDLRVRLRVLPAHSRSDDRGKPAPLTPAPAR